MNPVVDLLKTILDKDNVNIKEFLSRLDSDYFELFPNRDEHIKNNDFRALIKEGIEKDKFRKVITYKGNKYKPLKNGSLWINLMNAYSGLKKYDDSLFIMNLLLEKGNSDSTTLNDCSALILNKIMFQGKFVEGDNARFKLAKEMLYKAFVFDSQGKYKLNIIGASGAPAFKNLVLVRIIESQIEYENKNLFNSYIIGWISIEMSLTRIWCHLLSKKELTKDEKINLPQWDASRIIDALYVQGIIDKVTQTELHDHRSRRNRLVHGEILEPTKGKARNLLDLSQKLIPIFNPIDPIKH